jgi:diamine N-acetyltransferase
MEEMPKVILRAMEPQDLELLFRWENNPLNWKVSGTLAPFSRLTLKKFIAAPQDIHANKQLRLMIELTDSGRCVGCIDLFDFDPINKRAGVGILIAEESDKGKGFGKSALNELISYSKNTLNLHQLFCNISTDNKNSIQLFGKAGFVLIGVKEDWQFFAGEWIDEAMYQKKL